MDYKFWVEVVKVIMEKAIFLDRPIRDLRLRTLIYNSVKSRKPN